MAGASCDDGSPVSNIDIGPGETVTCTFTNTKRGTLVVRKMTVPSPDASDTSFAFAAGGGLSPASFNLKNGESRTFADIAAKAGYSVAESTPPGWDTTSTCSDGSPVSNIDIAPGETVTCTFVNRQLGRIVVKKTTEPSGSPQSFDFTTSYGPAFALRDGESNDSGALASGSGYKVGESVPQGWEQRSATCDDGSPVTNIDVAPGETVKCTFVNAKLGGPPDAVDDSLTTPENTPGTVGVLGNDTDPDGDALTVTDWTYGAHGSVTCTASGACTYTPAASFNGADSFTYTISDGHGGTDTAMVNVTVTPPPVDPPPVCAIVAQGKDATGKAFVRFRVQDTGSGLSRYQVVYLDGVLVVDPFAVGTQAPVFATATAKKKGSGLAVTVDFFDVGGHKVTCDPIATIVAREDDQPEDQTFTNVAGADRYVTIVNGDPGMRKVRLIVNGTKFKERDLAPGETRSFDIASALKPGNRNTITVSARGKKGASAFIIISDIPPPPGLSPGG